MYMYVAVDAIEAFKSGSINLYTENDVLFCVRLAVLQLDNDKNSLGPRPHGSDKCELWPQVILYGDESLVRRRPLPEIARIYCNGGV